MKTITMDFATYEDEQERNRCNSFDDGYCFAIESICEFLESGESFNEWWIENGKYELNEFDNWFRLLKLLKKKGKIIK